jgi:hypothetical protein
VTKPYAPVFAGGEVVGEEASTVLVDAVVVRAVPVVAEPTVATLPHAPVAINASNAAPTCNRWRRLSGRNLETCLHGNEPSKRRST